jgi:hypothetical protein
MLRAHKIFAINRNYVNTIPVILISLNFQQKFILKIMKYDSMLLLLCIII